MAVCRIILSMQGMECYSWIIHSLPFPYNDFYLLTLPTAICTLQTTLQKFSLLSIQWNDSLLKYVLSMHENDAQRECAKSDRFPLPHYPRRTAFPASLLLPFSPHRTILYWFLLQVRALRNIYDRMLIVVLGFPCRFCKSRDGMVYWECCWRIPGERKAGVEQRWIVFPAAILADGVANSTFAMDRTFVNIVWTAFG